MIKHLVIWTTILLGFFTITSTSAPISYVCVPNTWTTILVFYGVNYLAHAGTVPTPAGAKWEYALQWTLAAFLLPFVGLGRSFALIYRHFTLGQKNELSQALASNALVVLGRSKEWKPLQGEEPPENFSETLKAENPYAHSPGARTIYGNMKPPKGYRWLMLSPDIVPDDISTKWNEVGYHFSKSQSWLKMGLSVAQLIYSCITIYRTRGDQILRYGYAAYGLSVFPYAFMSLANFTCAAWIGEYACVYALTSPVMEEAKSRGGKFEGAIDVPWQPEMLVEKGRQTSESSYVTMSSSVKRKSKVIWTSVEILICGLLLQVPQYLLLYFLTKFEKKQSTLPQRAWMMAWVCANQASFFAFACLSTLWPHFLNSSRKRLVLFVALLPFGVAAIGGLVEVGLMMKYFQTCTVVPSS